MQHKQATLIVGLLALAPFVHAATVEITWGDPQKFKDIRTTDANQQRFQTRTIAELEKEFRHQAEKLPVDQVLHVNVEDLDLAGEIEYFYAAYPFGIRVVRRVDFPSLKLSYELQDASGKNVKSGETSISDLGFRLSMRILNDSSPLRYEKELIHKWYQQTFEPISLASQ